MGDRLPRTACEAHPRIFASTDANAHAVAASHCRVCPVFALCARDLKNAPPSAYAGTWAGVLLTGNVQAVS